MLSVSDAVSISIVRPEESCFVPVNDDANLPQIDGLYVRDAAIQCCKDTPEACEASGSCSRAYPAKLESASCRFVRQCEVQTSEEIFNMMQMLEFDALRPGSSEKPCSASTPRQTNCSAIPRWPPFGNRPASVRQLRGVRPPPGAPSRPGRRRMRTAPNGRPVTQAYKNQVGQAAARPIAAQAQTHSKDATVGHTHAVHPPCPHLSTESPEHPTFLSQISDNLTLL